MFYLFVIGLNLHCMAMKSTVAPALGTLLIIRGVAFHTQTVIFSIEGIVKRKLRGALINIKSAADIFLLNLKGHHPLNSTKPVLAFIFYKNYLCSIKLAPAAGNL